MQEDDSRYAEEDEQAKLYQPHAILTSDWQPLVHDEVGCARYASPFILMIAVSST